MRRVLFASLLLAIALGASPALADNPFEHNSYAGVELGFGSSSIGDVDAFIFSPLLHGRFAIGDRMAILAEWGFAYASFSGSNDSESSFNMGNPFIGFSYRFIDEADVKMAIEPGIALPLASWSDESLNDAIIDLATYSAAITIRGSRELWLFAPNTLSIVVPLRVDRDMGQLVTRADVKLAVLIPTGDNEGDTEMLLDFGGRFGFKAGDSAVIGLFLGGAWHMTGSDEGDDFQFSLGPYASFGLGGPELDIRFLLNIDEPGGFSFDDGKFWGLHAGLNFPF